jgi:hypothetical protein
LDLVEQVAPIQYAIRLLIPAGSRLLELPNVQSLVGAFDEAALFYPWVHPDPRVDQLQQAVLQLVQQSEGKGESRRAIFAQIWQMAYQAYLTAENQQATTLAATALAPPSFVLVDGNRNFTPRLSEPWYC